MFSSLLVANGVMILSVRIGDLLMHYLFRLKKRRLNLDALDGIHTQMVMTIEAVVEKGSSPECRTRTRTLFSHSKTIFLPLLRLNKS